jgi:hypothetical protein
MPEPAPLCFYWGPSEAHQEHQFSPNALTIATDKLAATSARNPTRSGLLFHLKQAAC